MEVEEQILQVPTPFLTVLYTVVTNNQFKSLAALSTVTALFVTAANSALNSYVKQNIPAILRYLTLALPVLVLSTLIFLCAASSYVATNIESAILYFYYQKHPSGSIRPYDGNYSTYSIDATRRSHEF
jgi:hypothetical protein